jgi:hypothetical protein
MKTRSKAELWIVLFVLGGFLTAAAGTAWPQVEPETQVFSVMSANLTSGNFSAYEAPGIRILQGLAPDVVLVQEFNFNGNLRDFVDEAFGPEFFYYVEPGGESIPNGVVSRFPIISAGEWADVEVSNRDFAWAIIDVPGDIDLQVVSVHLVTSSAATRNDQAIAIKANVSNDFDPDHFIVVGGTMNVDSRSESAIDTFSSFLAVDTHIPTDQVGDDDTNADRSEPFDWVIPNALLDSTHTTLTVGSDLFPDGLVFDSRIYPAPLPSPILLGDSNAVNMNHMPVMQAYEGTLVLASVPALGLVGIGLLLSLLGVTAYWRLHPGRAW